MREITRGKARVWSVAAIAVMFVACSDDSNNGSGDAGSGTPDTGQAQDVGLDTGALDQGAADLGQDMGRDLGQPEDMGQDLGADLGAPDMYVPPPPPEPFASALAMGINHSCALLVDETVRCWGTNDDGQLGDATNDSTNLPVEVALGEAAKGVSASLKVGSPLVCAALTSGGAACWGSSAQGTLGAGAGASSNTPVAVSGLPVDNQDGTFDEVEQVSSGGDHACALLASGKVRCWGENEGGLLGVGDAGAANTPREVAGLEDAAQISAGSRFTCAVRTSGQVACWGDATSGRVANGETSGVVQAPTDVVGLESAKQVSAGAGFACAAMTDGTAWCWGSNTSGQLGDGSSEPSSSAPVQVAGLSGVVSVHAGWLHACALLDDGDVACWGGNSLYQLGDGTVSDRDRPVSVRDVADARTLSAGGAHNCVIRASDESVVCWGKDFAGSLGVEEPKNGRAEPVVFEVEDPVDPGADMGADAGADAGP